MSAGGPVSLRPGGAGVSLRPGGDAAGAASPFSSFAMGSKPQVRARRSTSPSPGAPQRPPRPRSNFDLARRRQTPSVTIISPPRPPVLLRRAPPPRSQAPSVDNAKRLNSEDVVKYTKEFMMQFKEVRDATPPRPRGIHRVAAPPRPKRAE